MASRSSTAGAAAIGFRAHSGWAALVAVAGPVAEATAVLRRRVELVRSAPRQPFHAAEGLAPADAEALVRRATHEATALAERAVREVAAELRAAERVPRAAGLLLAAGRPPPGLRAVLAPPAHNPAAVGELSRDVLRRASRGCGLELVEVGERELEERAARSLRRSPDEIRSRVAQWGRALGSPWTQDEKRSALVAWLALSEASGRGA